jgi:hypothetical protein
MLEQDECSRGVVRHRLRDAEHVVLVEQMAVRQLGRSGDRAGLDPRRALRSETGERTDVGAERHGLLPVEVARRHHHDVALRVLPYDQHVDDPHELVSLQALQLGKDLALEVVAHEGEREHLDRPDRLDHGRLRLAGKLGLAHRPQP